MIGRRALLVSGVGLLMSEATAAPKPDLSYAPQFIVGRNFTNVSDIFISLTCPDTFRAFKSSIVPFIRQNEASGKASAAFHVLVRNKRDLEFSAEVLSASPSQYGRLCLALMGYGAMHGKALDRESLPALMRHLRIGRRGGFSRSKAEGSLTLMNVYARESLRISSTPTYMKNGSTSWSL